MDKLENEREEDTAVNYKSHLVVCVYIDLLGTKISAAPPLHLIALTLTP